MTAYHGGKQRIGQEIARVIVSESLDLTERYDVEINGYCEPFCGMLGVYRHIPGEIDKLESKNIQSKYLKYKAGDLNKSVILMWEASQKGWKPPVKKVSKQSFDKLKKSPTSSPKKGFIGHLQSYRGKYFGGYHHRPTDKTYKTSAKNVQDIAKTLRKVSFRHGPYTQFSKLRGFIIYCDPPYDNTQQHYREETKSEMQHFNSEDFWDWCVKMSRYNIVFVSGYNSPGKKYPVKKIWSQGREKLFMIKLKT